MIKILDEVMNELPENAEISEAVFEGANIVLYTKNKEFFLDNKGIIKKIVDNIKKRIELRPDPSLTLDQDKTKDIIKKLIPDEAGIKEIIFDPQRSRVIIEAEKPGLAISKSGELLRDLKRETLWVPLVRRTPAIKSPLIQNIRQVLYENNDYRRKFLNQVGKRIYSGWIRGKKEGWIRITCLGAAREVGRSCFLLQTSESRILLDCGVNVAAPQDSAYPLLDSPDFKIDELDAVIISHPHLDHIGFLPFLFKYGYKGPIYCTSPTRDIGALLCLDYINIANKEAKDSLYGGSDVKEFVKHTICLEYGEVSDITPDVRLTFYNAGHNLGSSLAHLHIGNGAHNLLYTGDYNYENTNLLAAAHTKFLRMETLITESTYGGRGDITPSRRECEELLLNIINETIKKKGKILMPVLGVGRSQEIMLIIEKAMKENKIPDVPVYIQGMVWDVTAIHTAYPDYFNKRVKRNIFQKDENPFLSEIFKKVASKKEMDEVIEKGKSCIVMATSGMLTGGPSLEYFKAFAENKNNSLVLTCYQGSGSLGRRLSDGERDISFVENGKQEITKVKMGVTVIHGFSGHSNYKQLMNYMYNVEPKPKRVIVVHGEHNKCIELASSIHQALRVETTAPRNLDSIRLK